MANDGSASSQFTYSNGSYFPLPFHLQQQQQQQQQQPDPMAAYQYPNSHIPPTPTYQIPAPAPFKIPMPPSVYATPAPATTGYTFPQYQQAQQLFQRDALSITPEALQSVKAALASSEIEHKAETKKRAVPRKAAGQTWEDPTLAEWPENDYRLFCGDLGNEVNDEVLSKAFTRFPTFNMARMNFLSSHHRSRFHGYVYHFYIELFKVVRDKRTGKTRGFGFVSFGNPLDLAAALKEMNGKYVGNRPIKLRKSSWKERTDMEALEKQKHQSYKKQKQSKKSVLHK